MRILVTDVGGNTREGAGHRFCSRTPSWRIWVMGAGSDSGGGNEEKRVIAGDQAR